MNPVAIIGYSGHAFVVIDCLLSQKITVAAYCDMVKKAVDPFNIDYLGGETDKKSIAFIAQNDWFVSIGDNFLRKKIQENLVSSVAKNPISAVHASAIITDKTSFGVGTMIGPRAVINPMAQIGVGVILNSGCIIEHECTIGDFAHIAPGAILCGNVSVGECSFIGAGSVIKQGISIGKNVIVGAGSVVVKNLPDGAKAFGNPARIIHNF